MLSRLDDYPIHQVPLPVAHPGTSDRNHYDRYFFNGYLPDGEVYFGGAMGLYPNRRVIDAAFSIISDGVQRNVYASGLAPVERSQTRVGPLRIEVVEPMERIRVVVEDNEHGVGGRRHLRRPGRGHRGGPPDPLGRQCDGDGRDPVHPVRHLVGVGRVGRHPDRSRPGRGAWDTRPLLGSPPGR